MTKPDPPANGPGSQPGKTRLITLPLKPEHHPVVLAEQARRASDIQLRIADWITAFTGSLTATAAVVWNGDLPRPLQQILFDAADGITPPEPVGTGEHGPAAVSQ